jgi:hypothetical protein
MEKKLLILHEKEKTIEKIIAEYNKNKVASCKQIETIYKEQQKDNISPSAVYRIWKTKVKTNKLQLINCIKQTFFVLKVIYKNK